MPTRENSCFRGSRAKGHGSRCGRRVSIGRNAARRWRYQAGSRRTAARSLRPCLLHLMRTMHMSTRRQDPNASSWSRARRHVRSSSRSRPLCARRRSFTADVVVALVVLGVLAVARDEPRRHRAASIGISGNVMVLHRVDRRLPRVLASSSGQSLVGLCCGASTSRTSASASGRRSSFNCCVGRALAAGVRPRCSCVMAQSIATRARRCASCSRSRAALRTYLVLNAVVRQRSRSLLAGERGATATVLQRDALRSTSARFRLRCWGWGSGGCTSSSARRSSRCSSSRS